MRSTSFMNNPAEHKAYIITGPTSGIGRATAFEVAKHGNVVVVGRDSETLRELEKGLEQKGASAVSVVCDLSDLASVGCAAAEIIALDLPIVGLLNNAGIFPMRATKNALGWDNAFATNHIGPFVLTEALIPHLPDGANVVFVASGVEDPERTPAKMAGFRGRRYNAAEESSGVTEGERGMQCLGPRSGANRSSRTTSSLKRVPCWRRFQSITPDGRFRCLPASFKQRALSQEKTSSAGVLYFRRDSLKLRSVCALLVFFPLLSVVLRVIAGPACC